MEELPRNYIKDERRNFCMRLSGVKFRGELVWILRFRQKGGRLLLWWNLELLEEMDVLQFGSVLGLYRKEKNGFRAFDLANTLR